MSKKTYKSKGRPGTPRTQEWKDKISKSRMGFKVAEETKLKMSASHKGKKFTLEHRKKLGLKGEKNPMWNGGLSSLHQQIRNHFNYRQWRSDIFQRDHYTCVFCGIKNGLGKTIVFHADHIKPMALIVKENNIDCIEKVIECEELWSVNNGRTLCVECHSLTPTYGRPKTKYV